MCGRRAHPRVLLGWPLPGFFLSKSKGMLSSGRCWAGDVPLLVPTRDPGCAKEQGKQGDAEAVESSKQSCQALLLPAVLIRNPACSDQAAAAEAHFPRCPRPEAPHALAKGTFSAVRCEGGAVACWGSPLPPPRWLQPRDVMPPAGSITWERKPSCGAVWCAWHPPAACPCSSGWMCWRG